MRSTAVLAAILCVWSIELAAQQNATISGVVIDDAKSVVPGVRVTATDLDAGRQLSALTNETGEYTLLQVPPGRYSLPSPLFGAPLQNLGNTYRPRSGQLAFRMSF